MKPWLALFLFFAVSKAQLFDSLKIIYSWKELEFTYPTEQARLDAIQNGAFVPGGPLPIDVDVHVGSQNVTGQKPRVFITIPRFQLGVPVTLGTVTDEVSPQGNPKIAPFPNWEWNSMSNCNTLTSVYRVEVDVYDRLWILDTGKLVEDQICPPQLHVFDLKTDQLISQYKFPKQQYKDDSLYVTPVVDVRDNGTGDDTFVYIADVTGFSLIVYDHRNRRSWKIVNNLFYPYPPYGTFTIKGDSFDLMDGILGLALSPVQSNGDKILYFHSLASKVESYVPTSVIRNFTLFHEHPDSSPRSFVAFQNKRSSQSAAQAMDKNGVLYFGLVSDLSIACWNSKHYPEYDGFNIEVIVTNPDTLQFPSGLKVITQKTGQQELWILSPSFQKYMSGSLRRNETNFRIQAGYTSELVRGTKCDVNSLDAGGAAARVGK